MVRLYPDSWIYSACSLVLPGWNWLLKQDNGQHTKPDASFFVLHFKKRTGPEWKLILIDNFWCRKQRKYPKQAWGQSYGVVYKIMQKIIKNNSKSCFSLKKLILTSKRPAEHLYAGQNQFFNTKTTFCVIFYYFLRYFILKSTFYD